MNATVRILQRILAKQLCSGSDGKTGEPVELQLSATRRKEVRAKRNKNEADDHRQRDEPAGRVTAPCAECGIEPGQGQNGKSCADHS